MSPQTKSSAPDEGGAIVSDDHERLSESTLKSRRVTPREGIYRVEPSEPIGDTRVRAAPYRLLSTCNIATTAQIDGRGKYRAGGLSARAFKGLLGRETL